MSQGTFEKDPGEDLDYGFKLADWLGPGEVVASLVVADDPVGLVTLHDPVNTGTEIATWVSGGTVQDRVRITYEATTNNVPPRVFKRSLLIHVKRR